MKIRKFFALTGVLSLLAAIAFATMWWIENNAAHAGERFEINGSVFVDGSCSLTINRIQIIPRRDGQIDQEHDVFGRLDGIGSRSRTNTLLSIDTCSSTSEAITSYSAGSAIDSENADSKMLALHIAADSDQDRPGKLANAIIQTLGSGSQIREKILGQDLAKIDIHVFQLEWEKIGAPRIPDYFLPSLCGYTIKPREGSIEILSVKKRRETGIAYMFGATAGRVEAAC